MTAKTTTATRKPATRRRKPVPRARVGKGLKVPKNVPLAARVGMWFALQAAAQMDAHKSTVMSRKDAAILRMTHEGCPTCHGNGQIFTKDKKTGAFSGSKPCPAKPTKAKAGRIKVAMAARFSPDKRTGLVGWTCPCGKKEKPKFRDAKEATKALREHEKQKHGGKSVGGAWYGQGADATATTPAEPQTRTPRRKPASSRKTSQPTTEDGIMSDASSLDFNDPTTPSPRANTRGAPPSPSAPPRPDRTPPKTAPAATHPRPGPPSANSLTDSATSTPRNAASPSTTSSSSATRCARSNPPPRSPTCH